MANKLRDDQTITVLAEKNPKREGTAAHHMWEQYRRPKMRVDEYDSAIRDSADERVRMRLPARADQARRAILWDLDRGFIRLD